MTDWKELKLGDIITFQRGHDLPKTEMVEGEFPVAGSNGIIGFHNKSTTTGPGVTIGRSGNIGTPIFYPTDYWAHNTVLYIKDFKNSFPKFIYYFLRTFDFSQFNAGSAVPTLNRNHIHELIVKIPGCTEQIQIASILSCLDDKIDLLHRQNKTLEQLAETLFKRMLNVNCEKWEMKHFGEYIENTFGGEWGKEKPEDDYAMRVCCIRGTDIADLQTGLANRTPVRFIKVKKFENIQPNDGDLILEISGGTDDQSTGRTIYINELNRTLFPYPLIFSNFCRLIRPKKKEFSYFMYLYIQYLYKQDEFFNLENGSSGIKNLDYKYLLFDLNFLLPNNEKEIFDFNKKVEVYFEKINKNKHQIRTLTQLRDTLLPKLMSGEVTVIK